MYLLHSSAGGSPKAYHHPPPISELGPNALQELLPEIPLWVKTPDYERVYDDDDDDVTVLLILFLHVIQVDWLNKFLLDMWPFLDTAICKIIRSTTQPIFAEYIGKYQIKAIDFDELSLGTLPPSVCDMNEKQRRDKKSILAVGDISEIIPDKVADIVVLEEPEHLTWYHHGKRWKTKFRLVIGIIHTNYLEYVKREKNGTMEAFLLKGISHKARSLIFVLKLLLWHKQG
ncbi:Digalactosyldiacylglycerol synthase 2, chloroplastic [Glycine soja]